MDKVQISLSGVLQDLKDGLTRAEIGAKYGLNGNQTNRLFSNPKLKGKKTTKFDFDLVDDAPDEPIRVFEARKTEPALVGGFSNRTQANLPLDSNPDPSPDIAPTPVQPEPQVTTDPGIAPVADPQTSPGSAWDTAPATEAKKPEEPIVEQNGLW